VYHHSWNCCFIVQCVAIRALLQRSRSNAIQSASGDRMLSLPDSFVICCQFEEIHDTLHSSDSFFNGGDVGSSSTLLNMMDWRVRSSSNIHRAASSSSQLLSLAVSDRSLQYSSHLSASEAVLNALNWQFDHDSKCKRCCWISRRNLLPLL
jgi:hypothetical protein